MLSCIFVWVQYIWFDSTINLCTIYKHDELRGTEDCFRQCWELDQYIGTIANTSELTMNTSFENISAIYRDWLHSLGSQNFKGFHHKSQRLWTCCHHHRGAWWMTSILPERSQEVPNRIDRRAGVSSKVKSALWWWSDSRRWHYRVQKSWSQGKKWSPDQRIQIIQSLYISSHKLPSSCWSWWCSLWAPLLP